MSELTQKEKELELIEVQIVNFKREIDDTLARYYSHPSKSTQKLWDMRMELAEISLKNCQAIANYVRQASHPVANELDMRRRSVTRKLHTIERSHELAKLHAWYKEDLAPLLNKAEQAGYLVATTARKASGDGVKDFTWQLKQPSGVEEHVKLYGKRPDQFRYLTETCPICGNRIDEKGWCGCGNIGGG